MITIIAILAVVACMLYLAYAKRDLVSTPLEAADYAKDYWLQYIDQSNNQQIYVEVCHHWTSKETDEWWVDIWNDDHKAQLIVTKDGLIRRSP